MSGVWVFKEGALRLVENLGSQGKRKVLVHMASNEFQKRSTVHLISLPEGFNKFKPMHMYDIVVKNRDFIEVRDM
ncbi:Flowering-promoting factor 1-like protein [Trema orientale]|uniref:Flowering-promoting factor 1-like protein n=1 Tax=Trema orientale TaxID=63057 RepID=A0A2P5ERZ5_TREOI|nr:Flowering-promoting factor 1-like protein [Trema orientale]